MFCQRFSLGSNHERESTLLLSSQVSLDLIPASLQCVPYLEQPGHDNGRNLGRVIVGDHSLLWPHMSTILLFVECHSCLLVNTMNLCPLSSISARIILPLIPQYDLSITSA